MLAAVMVRPVVVPVPVAPPPEKLVLRAVDFVDLKGAVGEAIEELDHTNLNDHPYFQEHNPSSEEIARYIYQRLEQSLDAPGVAIAFVRVWESEEASATYRPAR